MKSCSSNSQKPKVQIEGPQNNMKYLQKNWLNKHKLMQLLIIIMSFAQPEFGKQQMYQVNS